MERPNNEFNSLCLLKKKNYSKNGGKKETTKKEIPEINMIELHVLSWYGSRTFRNFGSECSSGTELIDPTFSVLPYRRARRGLRCDLVLKHIQKITQPLGMGNKGMRHTETRGGVRKRNVQTTDKMGRGA